MIIKPLKTTSINKPKATKKPFAPQTPETSRPNLGRPTPKITKGKKKKAADKK
ncbi:MAG: hypothetical protein ACI8P3_001613 [Saprospiraceae bacterium]|jgi:hypothetical protein